MTAPARSQEPLPLWAALALLDLAIIVPAVIAQVWWRSAGMCSGSGVGCGKAAVYVAAPAVIVGSIVVVAPLIGRRTPMPRRATITVLAAIAAVQVFNSIPIVSELNDGCNIMNGRTVRALKLDRGPFTDSDVPLFGDAFVTQIGCGYSPPDEAKWRWGSLPAGELGG